MKKKSTFKVGDLVEVRNKEEILRTLDVNGELDKMPFMPEMLQYCGQRFRIRKSAHKTCDYSTPYPFRTRRLDSTVHLETRCDGTAHDGCQSGCLLYWKHSWLKPVNDSHEESFQSAGEQRSHGAPAAQATTGCTEAQLRNCTQAHERSGSKPTYRCQTTQIHEATTPLAWWDARQYVRDYWSGNVSLGRVVSAMAYSAYYHLSQAGIGVGPTMRWLYDRFNPLWGGSLFPRKPGLIPQGQPTPDVTLNLQPGELVRVKSHQEILKTVNTDNKNRGMSWDAELVPYCNGTYRGASAG